MDYAVEASALNLRSAPVVAPSNVLAILSRGERVAILAKPAVREGQVVTVPRQSQAGARNKASFATPWWVERQVEFEAVGFWRHD